MRQSHGAGDAGMTDRSKRNIAPPDYILAKPRENDVPEILGSCDRLDVQDLRKFQEPGEYIYKLKRGYAR